MESNGTFPWNPMEYFHGIHGKFPWNPWKMSMDSMANFHGNQGLFPGKHAMEYWIFSMESCSNTPGNNSMWFSMEIPGHSTDGCCVTTETLLKGALHTTQINKRS